MSRSDLVTPFGRKIGLWSVAVITIPQGRMGMKKKPNSPASCIFIKHQRLSENSCTCSTYVRKTEILLSIFPCSQRCDVRRRDEELPEIRQRTKESERLFSFLQYRKLTQMGIRVRSSTNRTAASFPFRVYSRWCGARRLMVVGT
jgi:hypothetical protein